MHEKRLDGLQVLRGFAALLVLLAHLELAQGIAGHSLGARWHFNLAAIGVDIFFVISGFVVTMMAERNQGAASQFLANRITRVYPLYLLASIPLLAIEPASVNKIWNTFFLVPVLDRGFYTNPAHWFGWSIASEMWFYCVFAFAMFSARRHVAKAFIAAICCIVFCSFFYEGDWITLNFLGSPLALEFVGGVLLYLRRRSITKASACFMVALSFGLSYCVSSDLSWLGRHGAVLVNSDVGLLRAMAWGIPAMLLVGGVVGLDLCAKIRWPHALIRLGDVSYSFYLMQPFGILFVRSLRLPQWWMSSIALFVTVLILSLLSNRFIELPITNWLRRKPALPRPAAATSF